jgi:hypothetical protein
MLTLGHGLEGITSRCGLLGCLNINFNGRVASFREHASPGIVAAVKWRSVRQYCARRPLAYSSSTTDSSFSSSTPSRPLARSNTKGVGHSLGANSLASLIKNLEHLAAVAEDDGRLSVKGEVKIPKSERVVGLTRWENVLNREAILAG